MIYEKCFDVTVEGHQIEKREDVIEWVKCIVWSECEISEQSIGYGQYLQTFDGIGIHYDYGADYYFFTDESEV